MAKQLADKPARARRTKTKAASASPEAPTNVVVLVVAKAKLPPPHVIREISVKSKRDPRSVERFLRGEPVRPIVAAAVRDALRDLGIEHDEACVA